MIDCSNFTLAGSHGTPCYFPLLIETIFPAFVQLGIALLLVILTIWVISKEKK